MSEKTCLGIDIGNNRAKIAVKKGGVVRRLLVDSVPDGIMKDNHIISYDAMGDFLRELLKKNHIAIKKAHLCMPIHEVYLRNVALPMMNVQQLKVNLPYEFHDYITEDMGNYIYDYAVLPDREGDGQLHLIACAASKTLISSHQQMAKRAKIRLESIEPANVALFRYLESRIKAVPEGEPAQDYAILDLGNTSIKIHFFTKGNYEVTRSMDFGIGAAPPAEPLMSSPVSQFLTLPKSSEPQLFTACSNISLMSGAAASCFTSTALIYVHSEWSSPASFSSASSEK